MEFKLRITLGNDAMQTGHDVAEALRQTAAKLDDGSGYDGLEPFHHLNIKDLNGNVVGTYAVKQTEPS